MARTGKLSAVEVAKAKGPAVLHDGGGLYLRVSRTATKSWVFRFQRDSRRRDMGLGPYPDISLAEARARASAHRKQVHDGIDPLDAKEMQRRAERASLGKDRTFREIADEFISRNQTSWRSAKHRQQWRNTLQAYVYPAIGDVPVALIDTGACGSSTRSDFAATVRGFRKGPNPAQWKGNLAHILPARGKVRRVEHYAALPFDDMPEFLAELRHRPGITARALEFAILTAARTAEVLGACWREIDWAANVWTIPGERTKAGREHRVPLSEAALGVLETVRPLALLRNGELDPAAPVFPGPRRALPLSNMTMLMLLRRMKRKDVTAHGFRSTFTDWSAERTAYPREVVEMSLAHAIENKVEAAYRRGDLFAKRRGMMVDWAAFCSAVVSADLSVMPIRGKLAG
jgi:integrase